MESAGKIAQNWPLVKITECRAEDVTLLEHGAPSDAEPSFHAIRYGRQQDGLSTYLVAWDGARPTGSCEVRWDGPAARDVRETQEDCPEINGLVVWPESMRGRGVGTALINAAESLARERGRRRIGLGVETRNSRAASLYSRLGYSAIASYVDRWSSRDLAGMEHNHADACIFMTKELRSHI